MSITKAGRRALAIVALSAIAGIPATTVGAQLPPTGTVARDVTLLNMDITGIHWDSSVPSAYGKEGTTSGAVHWKALATKEGVTLTLSNIQAMSNAELNGTVGVNLKFFVGDLVSGTATKWVQGRLDSSNLTSATRTFGRWHIYMHVDSSNNGFLGLIFTYKKKKV